VTPPGAQSNDGRLLSDGETILSINEGSPVFRDKEKCLALFKRLPVGIFWTRASDGLIIDCNDYVGRLLGYRSSEECLNDNVCYDQFIGKDYRKKMLGLLTEKGHLDNCEVELTRKDGLKTWVVCSCTHYPDLGISEAIVRDITDQKSATEKMAFQSSLLDQVHNGVIVVDLKYTILYWNKYAQELYQWTSDEAVGKNIVDLLSPEELINTVDKNFKKLNREGHWEGEFNVKRKDGTTIPAYIVNTLLKDTNGIPIGYIGISTDITERLRLEGELFQFEKMQTIGQLAGGIAHDFNNQLSGIAGYAHLLSLKFSHDLAVKTYSEDILGCVKSASELTQQLLAFSRKGKISSVPVDIHKTVKEVESILVHSIDKRITVELKLEAEDAVTTGDPAQLQNAFLNIAINARDAMPGGGTLLITSKVVELDDNYCRSNSFDLDPGNYLSLSMIDEGGGIDEKLIHQIFEPFLMPSNR